MKNLYLLPYVLVTGSLAFGLSHSAVAQTPIPQNSLPLLVASDSLSVGHSGGIFANNVESNVPYTLTSLDSVDWVKIARLGDKHYFDVAQNKTQYPRVAHFKIENIENHLYEKITLCQEGDLTIYPEDYAKAIEGFAKATFSDDAKVITSQENQYLEFIQKIESDGHFSDINYADRHPVTWQPRFHCDRMKLMATLYINPNSKFYKNVQLYAQIVKGLEYWSNRHPSSSNWWYNQIGYPTPMTYTLMLMRCGEKQLPKDLENKLLAQLSKDGGSADRHAGANKVWVATILIYHSLLTNNLDKLKHNLQNVYDPLRYTDAEGYQLDGGFFQHGPQVYIAGYGNSCTAGILEVAAHFENTKFASMSPQQKFILTNFVRNTLYNVSRGTYFMMTVRGRELTRPSIECNSYIATMAKKIDDKKYAQVYDDIIARVSGTQPTSYHVKPSNIHFFMGDYMVHIRPEFTFDCRMSSKRTGLVEEDNGHHENMYGHYLSYGNNNIARTGREYQMLTKDKGFLHIPIFLDWRRIAGATSPQRVAACGGFLARGSSTFAGAVSDSVYGASCFKYYDTWDNLNTGANKAWFCFDKEVVCLGRVKGDTEQQVMTTLNQCYRNEENPVYFSDAKEHTLSLNDSLTVTHPEWAYHNGVGYVLPEGGSLYMVNKTVHSCHYAVNHNYSKDPLQADVVTFALDHGVKPQDAPYAYILVPSVSSSKEVSDYVANNPIDIIQNTTAIQAVYQKNLHILQSIFYGAGTLNYKDISIETSRGCALMLKEMKDGTFELYVSDPTQSKINISVKVTLPGKSAQNVTVLLSNSGKMAGKSQKFVLK